MSTQYLTFVLEVDQLDRSVSGQSGVTFRHREDTGYSLHGIGGLIVYLIKTAGISVTTLALLFVSFIIVSCFAQFIL